MSSSFYFSSNSEFQWINNIWRETTLISETLMESIVLLSYSSIFIFMLILSSLHLKKWYWILILLKVLYRSWYDNAILHFNDAFFPVSLCRVPLNLQHLNRKDEILKKHISNIWITIKKYSNANNLFIHTNIKRNRFYNKNYWGSFFDLTLSMYKCTSSNRGSRWCFYEWRSIFISQIIV